MASDVCANCAARGNQAADSCANCGREASDAVELKNCAACLLVKYCSVDCQRAHRKQHKVACKERADELKDERLYGEGHERPESDFCPICTLPIPFPMGEHSGLNVCCSKMVCNGCRLAAHKRGMHDCPFCRTTPAGDGGAVLARVQKRVDAKDPEAITFLGDQYFFGYHGLEENVSLAVELWKEAVELGSIDAHFNIGNQYFVGSGVAQNIAKAIHYWEVAAMQGHVESRNKLGMCDFTDRNYGRAVRHFLITAKMGSDVSLGMIKLMFAQGQASKQQYAEALRGYQFATEEMKSPDRDEWKALAER
ncbi:hypothetical protein THAOC_08465, partial [Thalassiosira oceanica]